MLDEILDALNDSNPADRHQIKKYIAWLSFRRRTHNQFYATAHWVYTQKAPGLLRQASRPLIVSNPRNAHWL
jgi:hypothetical protein